MTLFNLARLSRSRSAILAGLGIASAGIAFNWEWLTSVGAAPILLGVVPCLVMCALGMCMRGGVSNTCRKAGSREPHDIAEDVLLRAVMEHCTEMMAEMSGHKKLAAEKSEG